MINHNWPLNTLTPRTQHIINVDMKPLQINRIIKVHSGVTRFRQNIIGHFCHSPFPPKTKNSNVTWWTMVFHLTLCQTFLMTEQVCGRYADYILEKYIDENSKFPSSICRLSQQIIVNFFIHFSTNNFIR